MSGGSTRNRIGSIAAVLPALSRRLSHLVAMVVLCLGTAGMSCVLALRLKLRRRETLDALYTSAVQSVPLVIFCVGFLSLVMVVELSFHIKLVLQQDSLVPSFSTVMTLRELAPTVTALLLASRVGASIAAEIATMKLTDQIDALESMGIDLLEYLVVPRWYGCVVASVVLSIAAFATASLGSAFISTLKLGLSPGQYLNVMFLFVKPGDFVECIVKAGCFGAIVPAVASYHGLMCRTGSRGVGEAATQSVVQSSVAIIIGDFILTFLFAF